MDFGKHIMSEEPLDTREGKLTLLASLFMLYVIALFLSTAIHEILGHGLFTVLLGGDFYAFHIAPGSGSAYIWPSPGMGASGLALIYMSGILVELAIGAALLFLALPRVRGLIPGMFTLMLCVCMLVHSSLYLLMGYYYTGGDTVYAVDTLRVGPDIFLVAGILLAGIFVLLLSAAALRFMGRFMDLDSQSARTKALGIFWLPPMALGGVLGMAHPLLAPGANAAYYLVYSALLLMFTATALFLVPEFHEPAERFAGGISLKGVFSILVCFILMMALWAGAFGLTRDTARGIMLHEPPVQAEFYYSDYTFGNAEFTVYANGTIRADIILRNVMYDPSPLENRIYGTFDNRPDWNRYIARSRGMLVTMFPLAREEADALEFSWGLYSVRAMGMEDELGRRCTTYFNLTALGTRQYQISPGDQTYQPGMWVGHGDISLDFRDPWASRGDRLHRVTVNWGSGLEALEVLARKPGVPIIPPNLGNMSGGSMGWDNTVPEDAPTEYTVIFKRV